MASLTLFLDPNYELSAQDIPIKVKEAFSSSKNMFFMKHQIDTYKANQEFDIVLNSYPTGTGKTKASLLHLIDKPYDNALFIAPTNELISQHCKDIKEFVKTVNLTHNIIEINAKILQSVMEGNKFPRKGEAFYRLLSNPLSEDFIDILNLRKENIDYSSPYILVTNPDIFYYSMMFLYNHNDKRNIFQEVFTKFNYIVIDEFHYYSPKQLSFFLFFFTLSLKFGYFKDNKRKVSILTATPLPQVKEYFDRLEKEGLKFKVLSPEKVEPTEVNSIQALTSVKLIFYSSDNSFSENITNNLSFLKNKKSENQDGAIISNSLININDCKYILERNNINDFGMITGVTDKEDRNLSKIKSLILATPTVDIGYNFDKDKNRQNIDYLIFDYKYEDQFWQRLGRAGRVLSKSEKSNMSEVMVFTDNDTVVKLREYFKENEQISREKLAIYTKSNFKKREDFYNYIESYGITEMAKPLEEIKYIFSKDKEYIITKDLFDSMCNIFVGKNISYYHKIQKFYRRFLSLEKAIEVIEKSPRDISIEAMNEFQNLYTSKDRKSLMNIKSFENFLNEEYFFIKGLYNFRESFQGITVLVYDPKSLMGFSSEKAFKYDLFHLLKYYDLKFFSSKSDFLKSSKLKDLNYKEDFYCEIIDRLEDNQSISFAHTSELDEDFFEYRYLNKITAKNNIEFEIFINKKTGKVSKSTDLKLDLAQNLFKEKYIPCLIINHIFKSECLKNNIVPVDFNVKFINGFSKKYFIILGTNAYLLASKPKLKFIEYMSRKTDFYCV